jgi:arylsulfatase A-like enzyme
MKHYFENFTFLLSAILLTLHTANTLAKQPDVLVIIADQWSPRYVGWDNQDVRTPYLDKIAHEGMIFDACYTTSPVCMPARVSLITGLYPHNGGHALWGNAQSYCPPADEAPMFRDIRGAGLMTAQIGKTHWTSGRSWQEKHATLEAFYSALGLDQVADIPGPPDSEQGSNPYVRHLRSRGLLKSVADDLRGRFLTNQYEARASVVSPEDYHDVFTTGLALNVIRSQPKDSPLCLVLSLHSPHPPFDAPGEFATMFDPATLTLPPNVPQQYVREGHQFDHPQTRQMLANYLGKMALVDECVGRIVDAMKARGTWENTLVLFTSDHGEMMGAHGSLSKGRFYEESVRVPLVARWPGRIQAGRSSALVQMMDIYPTIVEAVGGKLSPGRFARSLMPIATGAKSSVRTVAISEIGDEPPLRIMARDPRYKYWADESREFLFDLETDPFEMNELSKDSEHQATLGEMRGKLLLHLRSTQANFAVGSKPKVQRLREAQSKEPKP